MFLTYKSMNTNKQGTEQLYSDPAASNRKINPIQNNKPYIIIVHNSW